MLKLRTLIISGNLVAEFAEIQHTMLLLSEETLIGAFEGEEGLTSLQVQNHNRMYLLPFPWTFVDKHMAAYAHTGFVDLIDAYLTEKESDNALEAQVGRACNLAIKLIKSQEAHTIQ